MSFRQCRIDKQLIFAACNAVAMFENGILTMKNYGNRRNCTVSIIYPSKIQALNVDVGVTAERRVVEAEIGLSDQVVLLWFTHYAKKFVQYVLPCSPLNMYLRQACVGIYIMLLHEFPQRDKGFPEYRVCHFICMNSQIHSISFSGKNIIKLPIDI